MLVPAVPSPYHAVYNVGSPLRTGSAVNAMTRAICAAFASSLIVERCRVVTSGCRPTSLP
jgi:hypothetical protein